MSALPLPDARPPDESKGPNILGAAISTTLTALLAVCLRIYVRTCMMRGFGADDYVIILAMLLSLAGMGITIAEVRYGVGRHSVYLDPETIRIALKLNFISQPIFQWALPIAKTSIGLSLIRTGPSLVYKRIIQGVTVSLLAFTSARFVLLMIQCINIEAIWNPRVESKCLPQETMEGIRYTNSIVNVTTDISVLTLATIILWNTQSTIRGKFSLVPVLTVGIIACSAGILKPTLIVKQGGTDDVLWDSTSILATWNSVELGMGITASCMPCIKPMFQKIHESAARSSLFSKIDTYSLRPLSSYSSGRRISTLFQPQTRTEITAGYRRNGFSWLDHIDRIERMPNEIMRTTVVTVESTTRQRGGSPTSQHNYSPQSVQDSCNS